MNVGAYFVWGFAATLALSVIMAASQGLRLSRVSLPYMVGTFFTGDRDRARTVGFVVHVVNGWLFSLLYVAGFHVTGFASWWLGALAGLLHAAVVLTIGMQALPGLHPRMASPTQGPTVSKYLEPPGFLALHYGAGTPLAVVVAHVVFGALLGTLYRVEQAIADQASCGS